MDNKLTDSEFSKVCKVLTSKMGLNISLEKRDILNRSMGLAATEFGFQEMRLFVEWLSSGTINTDQIEILASFITIPETYFWREPQVFSSLTDSIIPELIKSKNDGQKIIRIWSAGCSTGEEAYSLAIALYKAIPDIEDWDINIIATDINPKALSKARAGIYEQWSFRNTPDWLKTRYFHRINSRSYEIIPEIKRLVTFENGSLIDLPDSGCGIKMDIIFCRNVLMYFTNEWIKKISDKLFNRLSENGWFVVASCELSSHLFPQYKAVNFPGAILYRKFEGELSDSWDIDNKTEQLTLRAGFEPYTFGKDGNNDTESYNHHLALTNDFVEQGSLLETKNKTFMENELSIRLLANQGHLNDAFSFCNSTIESNKFLPGLYFLRASILQELEKSTEAIASLRQAIFIDPDYVMGHFALGGLLLRLGNPVYAKRYFRNVLDLTKNLKNDDILPESEGLSVGFVREIIFNNMQTQLTQ